MDRTLHRIKLYGSLGEKFGTDPIEIYASSTRDIFRGLSSRFGEKFKRMVVDGAWHITKGQRKSNKISPKDFFMSEPEVDLPVQEEELHIFPAVVGAGGRGVGQIILGVVLIIVAAVVIYLTGGATSQFLVPAIGVALAGVASVAGGIMAMLTKPPSVGDYSSNSSADPRNSFVFNGAVNNTEQGLPVPLVYGEHVTGTTVISAGMDVTQL